MAEEQKPKDTTAEEWAALVAAYYAVVWAEIGERVTEELTKAYLSSVTGTISVEAATIARNLAKVAAESLLRDLTETQLNAMGETIAEAFATGKRPLDIANRLREVTMLDSNRLKTYNKLEEYLKSQGLSPEALEKALAREKEKLLKARRETIARTEGSKAVSFARDVEATSRGAKYKGWSVENDERLCPVCSGNEADGIIAIDDRFSSGDLTPPAHPNCRCAVFYVTSDAALAIARERQNQRIQETKKFQEEQQGK